MKIGGGSLANVKFPSDETAFIQFPFTINYSLAEDTGLVVIKDLATKCAGSSDLTVDYDLTVRPFLVRPLADRLFANAH